MTRLIRIVMTLMPIVAVGLIVLELVVTNELSSLGRTIARIDTAITTLRGENEILTQQVASASSLLTISEKARSLGFTKGQNFISLGEEHVALGQLR